MSETSIDKIARAVLYEGYILYPYRPCVKTRQRWTFGGIFPKAYSESHGNSDPAMMQTQCLIASNDATTISIRLRFLHLTDRAAQKTPTFERVESIRADNKVYQTWQEAQEREVVQDDIPIAHSGKPGGPFIQQRPFSFPYSQGTEDIKDAGQTVGRLVREQQEIQGTIEVAAQELSKGLTQLTIRIINLTPVDKTLDRDQAMMRAFASTHLILTAANGEFISLTDPPPAIATHAEQCQNIGCWPVLAGDTNQKDTLLVSPIILPDYPQIAPESPGDLFDGLEIDEILSLRIMTLTDEEKSQAAAVDDRVRQLLERTETLARDQMMNLHGTVRGLEKEKQNA